MKRIQGLIRTDQLTVGSSTRVTSTKGYTTMDGNGVLLVGRAERHEIAMLLPLLRALGPLQVARNIPAALTLLQGKTDVRRILIAPSFRDEYSSHQLAEIVKRQPLADLRVLVGPWIEGETRSGSPWSGARRMYLHQVTAWLRSELAAGSPDEVASPWCPATWCPATSSSDELWQRAATERWPHVVGPIAICSELSTTRSALQAVCTAAGCATICHGPNLSITATGVRCVVYDAVTDRSRWHAHTARLAQEYQPRVLVVLSNFPRSQEIQRLQSVGATDVLGKPFLVGQLLACLAVDEAISIRSVA